MTFDTFYTSHDMYKCIFFVDENKGCAAGYYQDMPDWMISTMYSTEGGDNWIVGSWDPCYINDIFFISESLGWAASSYYPDGDIYKTTNLGENWIHIYNLAFNPYSLHFESYSLGWVIGSGGNIAVTTDSGTSWTPQNSGVTDTLRSVFFLDSDNGYVCGDSGIILHTTDGGNQWTPQSCYTTNNLNKISFLNPQIGLAVGEWGTILFTSNGGNTWVTDSSGTIEHLHSVEFAGSSYVWIVGNNGLILKQSIGSLGVEEEPVAGDLKSDLFSVVQNGKFFRINYSLTSSGMVSIDVYDISGRNVANLLNARKDAGSYRLDYEPDFSSGSYFFTIRIQEGIQTKQTFYLK